jgi:hypothetical protein
MSEPVGSCIYENPLGHVLWPVDQTRRPLLVQLRSTENYRRCISPPSSRCKNKPKKKLPYLLPTHAGILLGFLPFCKWRQQVAPKRRLGCNQLCSAVSIESEMCVLLISTRTRREMQTTWSRGSPDKATTSSTRS